MGSINQNPSITVCDLECSKGIKIAEMKHGHMQKCIQNNNQSRIFYTIMVPSLYNITNLDN